MARKPGTGRPKRQSDTPDDAFIARVLSLSAWAKANARAVIVGATVLALVVLAGIYYVNFQKGMRQQAEVRLNEVRQAVSTGNEAVARRDLQTLVSEFDGTPAAREGRILLARLHLENGEPGETIPIVRPIAEDLEEPLGVAAATLLAAAYEAADRPDRAEAVRLRIADDARFTFQRREALQDAARARLADGDATGAVELYTRLVEMTPDTASERGLYEMRLAEARAVAGSSASAAGAQQTPAEESD
ncbi:MAG: tetratricopeptide repeat protein [Gemmatimonadota bacterium]